jgi:hypothetical protein
MLCEINSRLFRKFLSCTLAAVIFDKSSNRLNCINEHMNFQPPFFFPSPLGLRPTPLSMSLNKRMVVESINNTSLNVNPKVRLSDKNDWYLFTRVKYKSSKKALSLLRKPSQAVLFAGALSNPGGLICHEMPANPHISLSWSHNGSIYPKAW